MHLKELGMYMGDEFMRSIMDAGHKEFGNWNNDFDNYSRAIFKVYNPGLQEFYGGDILPRYRDVMLSGVKDFENKYHKQIKFDQR